MALSSKVLITGADGFTGIHLTKLLESRNFNVKALTSDLLDEAALSEEICGFAPEYVFHFAGIAFTNNQNFAHYYDVNLIGTELLLKSLLQVGDNLKKIIIASSASVYGPQDESLVDESMCPNPFGHYALSKYGSEQVARSYSNSLPIIITRPFNYTGREQNVEFVVPKIVNAFKAGLEEISLGNVDVFREFNDVRDVCEIYFRLMNSESKVSLVNISSGRLLCIRDILNELEDLTGSVMTVKRDERFFRKNEVLRMGGASRLMGEVTGYSFVYSIRQTLSWMLD